MLTVVNSKVFATTSSVMVPVVIVVLTFLFTFRCDHLGIKLKKTELVKNAAPRSTKVQITIVSVL